MFYYKVAILNRNLDALTYHFDTKIELFQIVKVQLNKIQSLGAIIQEVEKPNFQTLNILEITNQNFTNYQITLAKFIAYYYTTPFSLSFSLFTPKESVQIIKHEKKDYRPPALSPLQIKAYNFINSNLQTLLFGDTGSGKSEIYISFIAKTLNQGKQALFLMPEISLTPQMTKRLKAYFGKEFGVWHSKITKKEKIKTLEKFQNKEINFIVGARSALFLPFDNLGLIIVDEEHDDSYKNQKTPFYNAKDLAIFISKKLDIKLILGSATPLATTYFKIPHFRMKGTFFNSNKEFIYDESETKLSLKIISEIKKTLTKKEQIIIFLPTRANYRFVMCESCKSLIKCPHCAISLSLHSDKNSLICHYCNFTKFAKSRCEKCGSQTMTNKKIGTNELTNQLKEIFEDANIAKFDSDSMTTHNKLKSLLSDFNDKKIDILVGTQMLSKGHDYHNVSLAIILGIDEYLTYSDFRAREKTLALAIQVSGRAGRASNAKVIIQTLQKDFFSLYINDFEYFLTDELIFRKNLYPPYKRILRILITSTNAQTGFNKMNDIESLAKIFNDIEIVGYGKAQIEQIASKHRFEILLRANSPTKLIQFASNIRDRDIQIDIDPINFS